MESGNDGPPPQINQQSLSSWRRASIPPGITEKTRPLTSMTFDPISIGKITEGNPETKAAEGFPVGAETRRPPSRTGRSDTDTRAHTLVGHYT